MRYLFFYRKETLHPDGYVADFCPIERAITTCRIDSVRSSPYISLIRIGEGDLVRRDRVCCSCGFIIPDERTAYRCLVAAQRRPDEKLEEETNPGVFERHRDLIQLRQSIERGLVVDAELRRSLLKEQFAWLDRVAKKYRTSETKLDRVSFFFGLFSLVGWFIALVAVSKFARQEARLDVIGSFFVIGLILFALNAVVFFLGPRRIVGKQVIPLIATALRPLRPTVDDLRGILSEMAREGFHYSTKVDVGRLLRTIERSNEHEGVFRRDA